MKKGKILIICPDMGRYARSFGASQRNYFLSQYLFSNSYDVSVITINHQNRCRLDLETPFCVIARGKASQKKNNALIWNSSLSSYAMKYISPYGHDEMSVLQWVDSNKEFICKYINDGKISKVIISVPEFSLLWLAPYIKRRCQSVKLIFDYRDTWSMFWMKRNMSFYMEKYLIQFADHIIYAVPMYKKVHHFFKVDKKNFDVILNGYSEKAWKEVTFDNHRNEKMVFSFIGSIQFGRKAAYYRDPQHLLEAFVQANEQDNMMLRFVGVDGSTTDVREIVKRANGNIQFVGSVPPQESYQYMVNSDVVVAINQAKEPGMNYTISGKLYDYLRSGRDILYIGNRNNNFGCLIKKNKWGVTCENEINEIVTSIRELRDVWLEKGSIRETSVNNDIRHYSREYQNEKYRKIIDAL